MSVPRLYVLADVIVDVTLFLPRLPERGGDVLATASAVAAGGCGLNVLAAATRQGMPASFCGTHGTGPFGDLARAALRAEGGHLVLPPVGPEDTGFCVVLVDPGGERTFATSVGAEARLGPEQLAACRPDPGDWLFVSGYGLAYPGTGPAIAGRLLSLPAGVRVLTDPGPLVGELPPGVLAPVLARTDWCSCNAAEAAALTGCTDPIEAAAGLAARGTGRGGALVRIGAGGAVLALPAREPVTVPAVPVRATDSNGAGDSHGGVFLAALAAGMDPVAATRRANRAASIVVTRRGANVTPTATELDAGPAEDHVGPE